MEKVAGNYYSVTPMSTASPGPTPGPSMAAIERTAGVRGMHSGVAKAVEAHRQMVEERNSRKIRRDRTMDAMEAQQKTPDLVGAQQVAQAAAAGGNAQDFENGLIEPIESEAKVATVQAFQAMEPDRPFVGEPVPKGSYIDVQV